MQRHDRPATGHLAGPDAASHLFFFCCCCSFTGTVAAMRTSVRNHRTQLLGDRATWLFIIPNLEDILGNYFLLVFGLKAFTLSLTVSRKGAK